MKKNPSQNKDLEKLKRLRGQRSRNRRNYALLKNFGVYLPITKTSQLRAAALKHGIVVPPNSSRSALIALLAAHIAEPTKKKIKSKPTL